MTDEQAYAPQDILDLRRKLNDASANMYPGVPNPGDCYIFDVVLGIDPRTIVLKPITKKQYHVFILNEVGARMARPDNSGKAFVVTRKFTRQQERDIREWWPLLSDIIKGE